MIRDSATRTSQIKLYCSWSCFIPLTIQALGKLRQGYKLGELEDFLTPAGAESMFVSLGAIFWLYSPTGGTEKKLKSGQSYIANLSLTKGAFHLHRLIAASFL